MDNDGRILGTCFMDERKPGVTAEHGCQFGSLLVVSGVVLGREKMQLNIRCAVCWHFDNQRRAFLADSVPGNDAKTLDACSAIGSLDIAE